MTVVDGMEGVDGVKGWKWSKDWRMEGLLGKNGKGMAHYTWQRGERLEVQFNGIGKVSEVFGACGKAERKG
jgi:hypothetical protein